MTTVSPHRPFSPDHPVLVAIGFGAAETSQPNWDTPAQVAIELFVEFLTAGAFCEPWSAKWQIVSLGATLEVTFERLPADPSAVAVLVRMLMSLDVPPLRIQVRGTPAIRMTRSLPSTDAALAEFPDDRAQAPFAKTIEPGTKWLNVEVRSRAGITLASAQLIEQRLELWCQVGRAGGLSDVDDDGSITPGDVGRGPAAVGVDFVSSEIMYDFVSFAGISALVNLIDELARGGTPIDELAIT